MDKTYDFDILNSKGRVLNQAKTLTDAKRWAVILSEQETEEVFSIWNPSTRTTEACYLNGKEHQSKTVSTVSKSSETETSTQVVIRGLMERDAPYLIEVLDNLKGSYAVEHVLLALLRKGNQHTLYSLLQFIQNNR